MAWVACLKPVCKHKKKLWFSLFYSLVLLWWSVNHDRYWSTRTLPRWFYCQSPHLRWSNGFLSLFNFSNQINFTLDLFNFLPFITNTKPWSTSLYRISFIKEHISTSVIEYLHKFKFIWDHFTHLDQSFLLYHLFSHEVMPFKFLGRRSKIMSYWDIDICTTYIG